MSNGLISVIGTDERLRTVVVLFGSCRGTEKGKFTYQTAELIAGKLLIFWH
jgi:hypothetical protein